MTTKRQRGAEASTAAAAEESAIPSTPEELAQAMKAETAKPSAGEKFDLSADLFQRIQDRVIPQGREALKNGGPLIPLRKVTFQIDGAQCADGVFVDNEGDYITFELTLQSLNSKTEILALREVKSGAETPMVLARYSLYAVNGKPIADEQRDFLWESLGMQGRQIVFAAFQELGAASDSALGKYLNTRRES